MAQRGHHRPTKPAKGNLGNASNQGDASAARGGANSARGEREIPAKNCAYGINEISRSQPARANKKGLRFDVLEDQDEMATKNVSINDGGIPAANLPTQPRKVDRYKQVEGTEKETLTSEGEAQKGTHLNLSNVDLAANL